MWSLTTPVCWAAPSDTGLVVGSYTGVNYCGQVTISLAYCISNDSFTHQRHPSAALSSESGCTSLRCSSSRRYSNPFASSGLPLHACATTVNCCGPAHPLATSSVRYRNASRRPTQSRNEPNQERQLIKWLGSGVSESLCSPRTAVCHAIHRNRNAIRNRNADRPARTSGTGTVVGGVLRSRRL